MESNGRITGRQVLDVTGSDPVRYQVTLVDDENDLLMSLLFPDELQHALAESSHWVTSI